MKKIFILHGWAYTASKWESLLVLLKKRSFEPVLLKIPGLTGPIERAWTIEDYTGWLTDIVSKEKGKVVLLGHSNGGRICLNFTSFYPEKVKHLFLIDSAGIRHNEIPIRTKRIFFKSIAKVGKLFSSSEKAKKILYKLTRESDYKNASPIMRETFRNLEALDLITLLPAISVPTTIIWGENDRITPLSDGRFMEKLVKNSKLFIIENAKHSPQFTHTEEVTNIVAKQLSL